MVRSAAAIITVRLPVGSARLAAQTLESAGCIIALQAHMLREGPEKRGTEAVMFNLWRLANWIAGLIEDEGRGMPGLEEEED